MRAVRQPDRGRGPADLLHRHDMFQVAHAGAAVFLGDRDARAARLRRVSATDRRENRWRRRSRRRAARFRRRRSFPPGRAACPRPRRGRSPGRASDCSCDRCSLLRYTQILAVVRANTQLITVSVHGFQPARRSRFPAPGLGSRISCDPAIIVALQSRYYRCVCKCIRGSLCFHRHLTITGQHRKKYRNAVGHRYMHIARLRYRSATR